METNNVIANGLHVLTEGMSTNNLIEVEISLPEESITLTLYTTVLHYDLASENASRRLRVYLGIKDIDPASRKGWDQLLHKQKGIKHHAI